MSRSIPTVTGQTARRLAQAAGHPMFEARMVTGRDDSGTTYDADSVLRFPTLDAAANTVAQDTRDATWDIFDPTGTRLARVHVDGGIDHVSGLCEWFALCTNAATHNKPHPVLGSVPCCGRCASIGE